MPKSGRYIPTPLKCDDVDGDDGDGEDGDDCEGEDGDDGDGEDGGNDGPPSPLS